MLEGRKREFREFKLWERRGEECCIQVGVEVGVKIEGFVYFGGQRRGVGVGGNAGVVEGVEGDLCDAAGGVGGGEDSDLGVDEGVPGGDLEAQDLVFGGGLGAEKGSEGVDYGVREGATGVYKRDLVSVCGEISSCGWVCVVDLGPVCSVGLGGKEDVYDLGVGRAVWGRDLPKFGLAGQVLHRFEYRFEYSIAFQPVPDEDWWRCEGRRGRFCVKTGAYSPVEASFWRYFRLFVGFWGFS